MLQDDHYHKDQKKEHGAEGRYLSKPQKAHSTGEFVIVAKFSGHVLHHLASRLVNVIREGQRREESRLKKLVLVILKPYLSFYNCCNVLCTMFSNVKAV